MKYVIHRCAHTIHWSPSIDAMAHCSSKLPYRIRSTFISASDAVVVVVVVGVAPESLSAALTVVTARDWKNAVDTSDVPVLHVRMRMRLCVCV